MYLIPYIDRKWYLFIGNHYEEVLLQMYIEVWRRSSSGDPYSCRNVLFRYKKSLHRSIGSYLFRYMHYLFRGNSYIEGMGDTYSEMILE